MRQAINKAIMIAAPTKDTKMAIELDCEAAIIFLSFEMHYLRLGNVK
jgi:hypothetical protein